MSPARFISLLLLALPVITSAQIIQTWTQKSLAGDTTTAGESSAAVAMDANYMFVADNEHETLRLFTRFPATNCIDPVYSTNMRPWLNLSSTNPEDDIEAAVKASVNGTNRIYWLGSHSNSKSGGNLRTNRNRLFATQVNGNGTGSPPYSLAFLGRYDNLRNDLANWDRNNQHGLGSNYFGLVASTNAGVASEDINGFNLEGLAIAPDGTNAWLGFRTPLVNGSGPTTNIALRTHALIVPVKNLPSLVVGNPTIGLSAQFGSPIRLNLGGRGIRSMDAAGDGSYLITAGPPGDVSSPPAAPLNFRLYTWTGNTNDAPLERTTDFPTDFSPEGAMLPAGPVTSNTVVQFVSDDSVACWKSFTANVGATILPPPFSLTLAPPSNGVAQLKLTAQTGLTYTVEFTTTLTNWSWLRTVNSTNAVTPFPDPAATNEVRFYRARY